MTLYDAMHAILVDERSGGEIPLENLYLYQLPPEQTKPVDVAHIPLSGVGTQRYLGSSPVVNAPERVDHDGGVLWHHTGVQFQVRGDDPLAVMRVADWIRDVLVQYAGTSVVRGGEEIIRCEITVAPTYFGQDEQERPITTLTVEVWHRPVYGAVPVVAPAPGFLQWGGDSVGWGP